MRSSPYRLGATHLRKLEALDDAVEPLETFNVGGNHGSDGPHGRNGAGGLASGESGRRGGDAGDATPGQDAGAVRITIETAGEDGIVRLGGVSSAADRTATPIEARMAIGTEGFVELYAIGGNGGDGGNGGRGGDGATGYRGRNANSMFSGTNGGPGARDLLLSWYATAQASSSSRAATRGQVVVRRKQNNGPHHGATSTPQKRAYGGRGIALGADRRCSDGVTVGK